MLRAGGNAYDAVIAALATSFVAEPVLSSPGGGGFLLAVPAGERPRVYDFFVQTPRRRRPCDDVEFYPVMADFGPARQEFHIGRGTVATPGMIRGSRRFTPTSRRCRCASWWRQPAGTRPKGSR